MRSSPISKARPSLGPAACLAFIVATSFFLGGCAAEAPPSPPRVETPARVTDLKLAQVGHTLILSFTAPARATDGRRLTKPIDVEIFRNTGPKAAASAGDLAEQKPWVVISSRNLARFNHSGEIRYSHALSPAEIAQSAGSVFSFAVLTLTRGFRGHPRESAPSNLAQTMILNVAPPPNNLRAVETRGAIDLRWSAPSRPSSETSAPVLAGYKVYRSAQADQTSFELAASTHWPRYQDTHFQFGTTYSYKVRAVFAEGAYTAETADSGLVRVTPRPVFPPPSPSGLAAVFTGQAVELIWKPEAESGIAGYNIYRRADGVAARRLNRQLVRIPAYADEAISPGILYLYWVTAVDKEQNESAPSSVATVRTQ